MINTFHRFIKIKNNMFLYYSYWGGVQFVRTILNDECLLFILHSTWCIGVDTQLLIFYHFYKFICDEYKCSDIIF